MKTFGDRVSDRRILLKISQAELAAKIGVGQSTVGQIENGRNKTFRDILTLAKILKTTPEYLVSGVEADKTNEEKQKEFPREASNDDFIIIPEFKLKGIFSMSNLNNYLEIKKEIAFSKTLLVNLDLKAENLGTIYAKDKGMEPTILSNSAILVDFSQQSLKEGKVFALQRDDELLLRRASIDKDGSWIFYSDNNNKEYPEIYHLNTDIIIGRIVWVSHIL